MFWLGKIVAILKSTKKEKKIKSANVEKEFPRFRASVEEGLGLITDGIFEYYCNECKVLPIKSYRHHALNKEDFDICEICLINNIDKYSEYKFKTTLGDEHLAECQEINYIVNMIFKNYNNDANIILMDFNDFLNLCNLKKYKFDKHPDLESWLKCFNSYTLNLFTKSKYYKKRKPLPKYNFGGYPKIY